MKRQPSMRVSALVLCLPFVVEFFGLTSGVQSRQEHAGAYSQADVQVGLSLYSSSCITCHGQNGDLVPGVDLRSGTYERAASDEALGELIASGVPGTAMPPGEYSDAELIGLVAYLRSMGDVDVGDIVLGDADRGRLLYQRKGNCERCHRINGEGSRLGPDLSDVGLTRTAGLLQQALLDPTGSMFPINRQVRIITVDGTTYTGRRVNEDTHTVQILDQGERLRSFEKTKLVEFNVMEESIMPSYTEEMTSQEISDLVAYLLSLRGPELQ